MIVKRDKYDAVVKERDDLQTQLDDLSGKYSEQEKALNTALESNDELQTRVDTLEKSDIKAELDQLKAEKAQADKTHKAEMEKLTAEIKSLKEKNGEMSASITAKDQDIADLQAANDRLNKSAAERGAHAHSQSDNETQESDLNEFCAKNSDNKAAVWERLEKEGF